MSLMTLPAGTRPTRLTRREADLLAWLHTRPDSTGTEAATALDRSTLGTLLRLRRLQAHGLVLATRCGDDVFDYTVYRPTP